MLTYRDLIGMSVYITLTFLFTVAIVEVTFYYIDRHLWDKSFEDINSRHRVQLSKQP